MGARVAWARLFGKGAPHGRGGGEGRAKPIIDGSADQVVRWVRCRAARSRPPLSALQSKMSQPTFSVADIRKSFLDFFATKGHTVVPSSSLVPANERSDPDKPLAISKWPDGAGRPRSATVVITRNDGGVIGT